VNLRPYQKRCLSKIWEALEQGENALLQAPTGAGKSIIVASITDKVCSVIPNGRVLILVDREILVTQLQQTIKKVFPHLGIGVVCASVSKVKNHQEQVTIASRQTLINHLNEIEPVNLIIADEAHLMAPPREETAPDQYGQIITQLLNYNPKTRIMGCSATPYRLSSGYIFGHAHHPLETPYFHTLTDKITYKELTDAGFLSQLRGMVAAQVDLSQVGMVAGEYNLGQLSSAMQQHVRTIRTAIDEYAESRKKIMIFCVDIAHTEKVAASVPGSVVYHSELSKDERKENFLSFIAQSARVIVSVATLTTGFDCPEVDCVVMARPTMSASLFVQMIGRGLRVAEGKTDCLLIDLTPNTEKHLPGNSMDKVSVPIPRISSGEGEAPYKLCPGEIHGEQCLAQVHPKIIYCPECGHFFEKTYAEFLPDLKEVNFSEPAPIDEYIVESMEVSIHESRVSKKNLLKVSYEVAGIYSTPFFEYVCLPDFYSGYAVEKARIWWEKRSPEPFPGSVDEALFVSDTISRPSAIRVQKEGRFDKVVECVFGEVASLDPYFSSDEVPF
jgi:DNA repair protein RadD